ncbi:MAG: dihydroorotase family protein [Pleurocapsa minor GSE-CHR-MK-17-07R]|jgi:carbamoyl-phosphate synthase/aspartate carbamoyltransferase/dihydroorotase|nr:dihydroorotase family protein [Pleurocapsa minor GSE-CHR-MK 17-07R]
MGRILTLHAPIDVHVHLRGMDWAHKGTFLSETTAALAGGYVCVLDMPNTLPSTTTPDALAYKLAEIGREAVTDWGVYYGAGQHPDAQVFAQVGADVCGMKMYCNETTGELLIEDQALREAHFAAWKASRNRQPIAVHAENETVLEILALVRKYGVRTHFCHISTAQEIDYLRAAKEEGLLVTLGVCPHHLYLHEGDLARLGAHGMMKPPLKTQADCEALWAALADGTVDVIESDHAPHSLADKAAEKPAYGVPGLETTIPLMCTAVKQGRITMARLAELVTLNAARIFNIAYGGDTYTEIDFDEEYTLERGMFRTLPGWSPFEGMTVNGRVKKVVLRGQTIFEDGHVLAAPGSGGNVRGMFA